MAHLNPDYGLARAAAHAGTVTDDAALTPFPVLRARIARIQHCLDNELDVSPADRAILARYAAGMRRIRAEAVLSKSLRPLPDIGRGMHRHSRVGERFVPPKRR